MVSFHFNEIEHEQECDPNLQFRDSISNFESRLTLVSLPDLDYLLEPILIPVPINLEHESLSLESHITLLENEYELLLFDLDPTFEPYLILGPKLDLDQFHESILVPKPFTLESKSTISTFHISLLDQGVEHYDSKMIFQD